MKQDSFIEHMFRRIGRYMKARGILWLWKGILGALLALIFCFTIMIVGYFFRSLPAIKEPFVTVENVIYGSVEGYQTKHAGKPLKKGYKLCYNRLKRREPTYHIRMKHNYIYVDDLQYFDLHNPTNIVAAVEERVAVSNVTQDYHPDFDMMQDIARNIGLSIKDHVLPVDQVFNVSAMREYIETRPNYSENQKKQILKVLDKYDTWPLEEVMACARYHSFIKDEGYPKNNRPRSIMACDDITKVIMGVIYNQIGEVIFGRNNTIKLRPIFERPEFTEQELGGYNYVYQTDHTAFEAAATKEIQQHLEQVVYRTVYPELSWFFDMMAKDETVRTGFGPDQAQFRIPCSRWSGAPNTSLGNTITNMVFLEMMQRKFDLNMKYLVEGDDGLLVTDKPITQEQATLYARQNGFDLKFEQKESLGTAGFLSTTWDNNGYRDVMDRWKYLKNTTTMRPYDMKKLGYWNLMAARMMSAVINIPKSRLVYRAYLACLKRGVPTMKLDYYSWLIAKVEQKMDVEIQNDNMVFKGLLSPLPKHIYDRDNDEYGITPELEEDIIRQLDDKNDAIVALGIGRLVDAYYEREQIYTTQENYLSTPNVK